MYSGAQRQKNTANAQMRGAWPPLQTFIAADLWVPCFPRGDLIEQTSVGCVYVGRGNFRIAPQSPRKFPRELTHESSREFSEYRK
jgi:hypothetical protein